jgi:hypothetical protein
MTDGPDRLTRARLAVDSLNLMTVAIPLVNREISGMRYQ